MFPLVRTSCSFPSQGNADLDLNAERDGGRGLEDRPLLGSRAIVRFPVERNLQANVKSLGTLVSVPLRHEIAVQENPTAHQRVFLRMKGKARIPDAVTPPSGHVGVGG